MTETAGTFHRRPLPSTCTALASKEGRIRFKSALAQNYLASFFPLIEQFTTQSDPAYCGISTLVIVLNALSVDPLRVWKGSWRWYNESMLNCCVDLNEVKSTGITLNTFVCLARCQGLKVELHRPSNASLDDFRSSVRRVCLETTDEGENDIPISRSLTFMVVSYSRRILGQTGDGHFSPLAAYDASSDEVLVLDTARFKYGPHWVSLELLYAAMLPVDAATNMSRGYALMSYPGRREGDRGTPDLPQSILFRSEKLHDAARCRYNFFLGRRRQERGGEISWEEVLDYWTRGGTENEFVWEILQPQLLPSMKENEGVVKSLDEVKRVRELLQQMLPVPPLAVSGCCQNKDGSLCLNPLDAVFIIFLASLSQQRRQEIVMDTKLSTSVEARYQLLAEA
eukprot:CAMPEP_0113302614 /NCGR_PEP_ID=MMETSP0010_2-20120614/3367_1 /TAXON_ID=216773 ORGANISM="Corethron hystrix, Strain 308" /NCGR_SAMPLE_ID=MMETSP0010_2 /ASSEMBLY_ACC=CAM_ASM_000155 /LENGTH=396 /DNA_ID=CAMNT_0000156461 /DNA_START=131 /DNA_END=1318 /DNA_ORIENTATION=- /assembly_acc=CAM_ASM_000155